MKLSAPVHQLKRRAKLLSREKDIPLHRALDQIAREEGFTQWSQLSARMSSSRLSKQIFGQLVESDLLLIAARPGHGKTTLGFQLLIEAAQHSRKAFLFSLEQTEQQARKHLQSLEFHTGRYADAIQIFTSNQIDANYIIQQLSGSDPGTVAIVDYLQLLDQQRWKPELSAQVDALSTFAKQSGIILGFIAQVDRSFELEDKRLPDTCDVRLPNFADLRLFSKACFLHNGEAKLRVAA